ncbi:MAG TPA: CRISPR-associated helicase Cas3' [Rhodanobacteraceae bacterium]
MNESCGNNVAASAADAFYAYWGKAGAGETFHRLAYHSLDVAAVGAELLQRRPRIVDLFADVLAADRAAIIEWLTFWIALHDLGKFAVSFQGQRADLLQRLQQRTTAVAYTSRHDSLGAALLKTLLRRHDALGTGQGASRYCGRLAPWVDAVTGHHGQPPRAVGDASVQWERCDQDAAFAFMQRVRALLLSDTTRDRMLATERLDEPKLSWWLAGVTVLADWLGSNVDYFPYCERTLPLADYWKYSQCRAQKAVAACGLLPRDPTAEKDVATLFDWTQQAPARQPTPLQRWAETSRLADGPQLLLLEDVTGAGKTEAALELAQRLIAAGHADGLFVGLPTMATANAMYARIAPMASNVFDSATPPSVVLAHGQRKLSPAFRDSILQAATAQAETGGGKDETASARCAAWLADSNKKALLANIGVGTLDQALLAIVHARHQSLRLLGLYRKVLVVDEVHACDAYMQALLERLLQFHAAAGGSAILLTATLPRRMKQSLVAAFCSGRGRTPPMLESDAYPLATQVAEQLRVETHVPTRPEVCRRVAVAYRDTEAAVIGDIKAALSASQCVCWVRNTVADALAAYDTVAATLPADAVTLFHARFAMGDRLAIEERVLARFGPDSRARQRRGQLVIATQVIEQSLDLDFDLLITDLAPIDRIIQRAGRMQRHLRDRDGNRTTALDQRGGASLIVYGPACTDPPPADWYRSAFPRAAYVYDDPGKLWLTARWLTAHDGFAMPEDARDMVESVFGEAPIPEALQPASDASSGKAWAARNLGAFNALALESGYRNQDGSTWARDGDEIGLLGDSGTGEWGGSAAATRLGDPTLGVRLARWDGQTLTPWCGGTSIREAWEASSVRMSARWFDDCAPGSVPQSVVDAAAQTMGDNGRWSRLLVLSPSRGDTWTGASCSADGQRKTWQYDCRCGLRDARPSGSEDKPAQAPTGEQP